MGLLNMDYGRHGRKEKAVTAQQLAKANAIRVITRPEIMGLWGMEIPNNKKCVEYYNFRGMNEVVIKSNQDGLMVYMIINLQKIIKSVYLH